MTKKSACKWLPLLSRRGKFGDVVFEMWTLISQLKCHMQGAEYEYLFVFLCSASSADSLLI